MKYSLNGYIYRFVIDPVLSCYYRFIIEELKPDYSVIDIACGTGSLSLAMSGLAYRVTGIDLSEEMIDIATYTAGKKNIENARFEIKDASDLSSYGDNEFDMAVASMAVHQFDADLALVILREMKRIASKVVLMDYNYPIPPGISKLVIFIIERMAKEDHYRNFRRFNSLGGLGYFIEQSGLRASNDRLRKRSAFRIVVCS
ncbi:MAG: class I SAM-dependent methyltransferase [Bacteroidales bacterium]|nr:class I SAM-dependent methyltransferase [Bacteroidales bacterium]